MHRSFGQIYAGKTVLVTGHTGFKGTWLAHWLHVLGARVVGFSLEPPTAPSMFALTGIGKQIEDERGDVQDAAALRTLIATHQPQVIFHLAAQPLVIPGYEDPLTTFNTNTTGTIHLLDAIRHSRLTPQHSALSVVCITTDKVYENQEMPWGYRENDRLGGADPYSASKAMAELAITSYRQSYFHPDKYTHHKVAIASTRAGNVIGGGDFAPYRLLPDCMKALMAGEPLGLRNPEATRPWQHVLEPLSGYLWLGAQLFTNGPRFAEAWNFGPQERRGISTRQIVEKVIELWGSGAWEHLEPDVIWKETHWLAMNWDKAARLLGWQPVYTWEQALAETVSWFKAYQQGDDLYQVTVEQIKRYTACGRDLHLSWAN
ncbi:MAG: CDP-glucose 4,6-dehydratase [Anaerolineae bacterium]|nr:CDP-glucose 4,6-dehydratase [Anaerolineae bacterium]